MDRLRGKTAIITGASQGIGEEIALVFAEEGAKVFLLSRTESKLKNVVQKIQEQTPVALADYISCDITDPKAIKNAIERCEQNLGLPDILINNAGTNFFNEPLETTEEEWSRCFSNDLTGAWNCAKAVLPYMLKKKDGAIVNISSVHGHKIIPGCFPYPVAKHGLIGLTRALGIEYAKHNVRVNSISPGLIETPLTLRFYEEAVEKGLAKSIEEFRQTQAEIIPGKRIGTPREVAMVAVLLASDEARFINATDILIDGGRSALYHF